MHEHVTKVWHPISNKPSVLLTWAMLLSGFTWGRRAARFLDQHPAPAASASPLTTRTWWVLIKNTPWCLTMMSLPVSVFIFSSPWQKNLKVSCSSAAAPQVNAQPRLHWLYSTMSACSIRKISDFRLFLWFFQYIGNVNIISGHTSAHVFSNFFLNSDLQVLKLSTVFFWFSSTDMKNKNSPRSNLKFRFDKLSHSAAVSPPVCRWPIRTIHTSS